MTRFRFAALLVVAAVALAACGGGDGTEASTDTGGNADTPSAATVAAGGATGPAGDTGGDAGAFSSAECADALAAWSSAAGAATQATTGSTSDLDTTLEQLKAFAEAAPDEISADLTTVYEAFGKFVQAFEGSGYDPSSGQVPTAEQLAALQAASKVLADKDYQAASKRVSSWFKTNCSTT